MAETVAVKDIADTSEELKRGYKPLHVAAKKNDTACIENLISLGADVNVKKNDGETPLHVAAAHNQKDSHYCTIELLLKNGADVNARSKDGDTPLHCLVQFADVKTVKLLINFQADVSVKSRGRVPLLTAIFYKNVDVIQLLFDHNSGVVDIHRDKSLIYACMAGCNKKLLKCLMKNGFDINEFNHVYTPMMKFFIYYGICENWREV